MYISHTLYEVITHNYYQDTSTLPVIIRKIIRLSIRLAILMSIADFVWKKKITNFGVPLLLYFSPADLSLETDIWVGHSEVRSSDDNLVNVVYRNVVCGGESHRLYVSKVPIEIIHTRPMWLYCILYERSSSRSPAKSARQSTDVQTPDESLTKTSVPPGKNRIFSTF